MRRYNQLGLTQRETEILQYIIDFKTINGFAPTISEIAEALYTSRSFVRTSLYSLEEKGFVRYNEKKIRSIVVLRNINTKIS